MSSTDEMDISDILSQGAIFNATILKACKTCGHHNGTHPKTFDAPLKVAPAKNSLNKLFS